MASYNENFEENLRKAVPLAAKEIESKMHSDLVNLANGKVFNDTLNNRTANENNNISNVNDNSMAPQENTNVKTLVREKQNTPRVINTPPVQNVQNDQSIYKQYANVPSEENPFDSLRNSGNANANTILIVIASFVIVAMFIIICLTVFSSLGMLPF